ncbi:hypothetical protein IQ07DRAFT_614300 [Pyrenochaeta sp. DS3sAY3a]|nr:hypothetical protein IQ07DRAFT_614300 [Pyrenochaeta sp. DS3sAY3a]
MLDALGPLASDMPNMYIALEGPQVSRHGHISLLIIYFRPVSPRGSHLVCIVDSEQRTKVFFNILNASDALFSHFGIQLQAVLDLQLMEAVLRRFNRGLGKFLLRDLRQCIAQDSRLPLLAFVEWVTETDEGGMLFRPEQGGTIDMLNARPLEGALFSYCVAQVRYLPRLWDAYWGQLDAATKALGPWYNPFTEKHMLSPFIRGNTPSRS